MSMLSKIKSLLLSNNSVRQTVVKNTFWLIGGELVGRLIRAAIVIYSARLLGAAEYGIFSYGMAVAAFITIFSDIGVSAILTREASKDPVMRQRYFSTAFVIKLALIMINVLIVMYVIPVITKLEAAKALLPLVAIMIVFESMREFGLGLNRSLEKMEREALIKIFLNLAIAVLGFIALTKAATATSLMYAYTAGAALGFLLTVFLLRHYFKAVLSHFNPSLLWKIFVLAWPVGLLGVLGAIMINTDMIMLSWWMNAESVGYYAAAQKIILLLYVVPTLLASAVFPTFSRLANVNNDRFRIVFEKSITAITLLALPMVAGGTLLAPEIMKLLYGVAYLPAAATFQILATTLLIVFPSTIMSNALFAFNEQKQFLSFVTIGALSNAFFNYFLIPPYGIEGAAIATLLSQVLANFFIWRTMKRVNRFSITPRLYRILLATILTTGLIVLLKATTLPVIIIIALAILTYVVFLLLLKEPLLTEIFSTLRESKQTPLNV